MKLHLVRYISFRTKDERHHPRGGGGEDSTTQKKVGKAGDQKYLIVVTRFVAPFKQGARQWMWMRTDPTLDQDCGIESNCVSMCTVYCRVIVDNKCEFRHSSSLWADCAWPNDQTILRSVDSVVFGCHREMVREEIYCWRSCLDNDECERDMMRENDKQFYQGTQYLLHLEPAALSCATREKKLRVQCGVLFTLPSIAWESLFPASQILRKMKLKSALDSRQVPSCQLEDDHHDLEDDDQEERGDRNHSFQLEL